MLEGFDELARKQIKRQIALFAAEVAITVVVVSVSVWVIHRVAAEFPTAEEVEKVAEILAQTGKI